MKMLLKSGVVLFAISILAAYVVFQVWVQNRDSDSMLSATKSERAFGPEEEFSQAQPSDITLPGSKSAAVILNPPYDSRDSLAAGEVVATTLPGSKSDGVFDPSSLTFRQKRMSTLPGSKQFQIDLTGPIPR